MTSIVFTSEKKSSLKPLIEIAEKLGIRVTALSRSETEDMGLLRAMKDVEHESRVDTKDIIAKLRKRANAK